MEFLKYHTLYLKVIYICRLQKKKIKSLYLWICGKNTKKNGSYLTKFLIVYKFLLSMSLQFTNNAIIQFLCIFMKTLYRVHRRRVKIQTANTLIFRRRRESVSIWLTKKSWNIWSEEKTIVSISSFVDAYKTRPTWSIYCIKNRISCKSSFRY